MFYIYIYIINLLIINILFSFYEKYLLILNRGLIQCKTEGLNLKPLENLNKLTSM